MLLQSNRRKADLLLRKLHTKAKSEPLFRFYSLHDKLCSFQFLWQAWKLVCKKRNTAPGIDGVTVEDIKSRGEKLFIEQLQTLLRSGHYVPAPLKQVCLKKSSNSKRLISIPTLQDRVVQRAMLLLLTPIFDADFLSCSYGFRPRKRQHDAVRDIATVASSKGYLFAFRADIKSLFDNIPHYIVIALLQRRIADKQVLEIIRQWLRAPITGTKLRRKGIPQGGPLSPLLANIVLHEIDKAWHKEGSPCQRLGIPLFRYADDIVLLMQHNNMSVARSALERLLNSLHLRLNNKKSKLVNLSAGEKLQFLGFELSVIDGGTDGAKVSIKPQQEKTDAVTSKIRKLIELNSGNSKDKLLRELLPLARGHREYFYSSTLQKEYPLRARPPWG